MLKDEPIEYIEEQYREKNQVLAEFGEQVSAWTLYEDVFEDLSQEVPVVIIDEDENTKKIRTMTIDDAVSFGICRNDTLLGGCTYFNNWISKRSARTIHTFIIDYDNAYSGVLLNALQNDWKSANGEPFARPTYIVNSGTGLHLYFVLEEPVPVYHRQTEQFDALYRALAIQQSRRVYAKRDIQWFGQDFRIGGGRNKYDWENTIFRIGDKWNIDELGAAVGLKDVHFIRYGEPRQEKPEPKKKKVRRKKDSEGWKTNRAFYDYTLKKCKEKTKEGNRYLSMCALAAVAYKCGVAFEEVEADLKKLLPHYNKGATRIIKEREIYSALKMYNDRAILTQRQSLENWQGWKYEPIKRNGRKQDVHLARCRKLQEIDYPDGEWRENNGRKSKEQVVIDWQQLHPEGKKADCIRDTGISKPTVLKHWKTAKELEQLRQQKLSEDEEKRNSDQFRRLERYQNIISKSIENKTARM